jgi:hypothetical protein
MRLSICIASLPVVFAASAFAADENDLSTRSRALAASKSLEAAQAPFTRRQETTPLPILGATPQAHVEDARGCSPQSTQSLCYEGLHGQLVYRGAREYMPHFDGLTPESVALRRGRLVLRYSFR